jgi:hypothetical protein
MLEYRMMQSVYKANKRHPTISWPLHERDFSTRSPGHSFPNGPSHTILENKINF